MHVAGGSHVFVCCVLWCDTAIMDECWQPVEWPQTEGLVLVVLTLAGHNNLLLVKQVSSWQNHYCLHMVMRAGEGLGNRFRGGWSWAMACLRRGCEARGGVGQGGGGERGIRFVLLHHWALESCLKLPQYKLAGLKNGSHSREGKTDDKPEDLSQTYNSIL